MRNKGFTLIELLVVVSIIGILSAIAVTSYIGVTKKAARSEAYSNLESIRLLEEQVFADNACYEPIAGGVCPAANNVFTCNATQQTCTGATEIQGILPRFQPGGGRNFNYTIQMNVQLNNTGGNTTANPPGTAANANCFVSTATGFAGTRVCPDAADCDMFAIDCNNNRNF